MLRACGEQLRLANTSVHLAVRLLDLFMDNHRVETPHLCLLALGCLLLASQSDAERRFIRTAPFQCRVS